MNVPQKRKEALDRALAGGKTYAQIAEEIGCCANSLRMANQPERAMKRGDIVTKLDPWLTSHGYWPTETESPAVNTTAGPSREIEALFGLLCREMRLATDLIEADAIPLADRVDGFLSKIQQLHTRAKTLAAKCKADIKPTAKPQ